MSYIVKTGGKQYIVEKGKFIIVDRLEGQEGDEIHLETLADLSNEQANFKISHQQTFRIIEHYKGEKVLVRKHKKRKRVRTTYGHRSNLTKILMI